MRFRDPVVGVMQQRAGEVRIGAAMDGRAGSDCGSEQVRADGDADGGACGFGDDALYSGVAHGRTIV